MGYESIGQKKTLITDRTCRAGKYLFSRLTFCLWVVSHSSFCCDNSTEVYFKFWHFATKFACSLTISLPIKFELWQPLFLNSVNNADLCLLL